MTQTMSSPNEQLEAALRGEQPTIPPQLSGGIESTPTPMPTPPADLSEAIARDRPSPTPKAAAKAEAPVRPPRRGRTTDRDEDDGSDQSQPEPDDPRFLEDADATPWDRRDLRTWDYPPLCSPFKSYTITAANRKYGDDVLGVQFRNGRARVDALDPETCSDEELIERVRAMELFYNGGTKLIPQFVFDSDTGEQKVGKPKKVVVYDIKAI